MEPETNRNPSPIYQIRVRGSLNRDWTGWFDGMAVQPDGNGETLITGTVIDQAALHGLLKKIRDLGLPLLSVNCVETRTAGSPQVEDIVPVSLDQKEKKYMDTLVSTEWLQQNLHDPNLVVLDCTVSVKPDPDSTKGFRIVNGRIDYNAGHIPGARFVDLQTELSDLDSPWNLTLPSPEKFCEAMGALGIGDDSRVVLYDGNFAVWAARVWWMLRWVGFDRAALLDGGLRAWNAEGRPISTELPVRYVKHLTPAVRPKIIADRDEVFASLHNPTVHIIDALDAGSFQSGHIPGAVNIDARTLLDPSGCYKSPAELEAMHPINPSDRVITYCGGGVAASSNAFVLTRLGFTNVAVYINSMQEWAADPANPVVTG